MPRTIQLTITPALTASYNLVINFSSLNEFNFRVMKLFFFVFASFISRSIMLIICLRMLTGAVSRVLQAERGAIVLGFSRKRNTRLISAMMALLEVSKQKSTYTLDVFSFRLPVLTKPYSWLPLP